MKMKRKLGSIAILSMIFLSSMLLVFQNSHLSPYLPQDIGESVGDLPNDSPVSTSDVVDYSKIEDDVQNFQDSADFSEIYYNYKNSSINQANATIGYLISNLWDSSNLGFNDSDANDAKKRTFDNMLMILTLLEYNDVIPQANYIIYAERIFDFEYNFLWDTQTNLFLSYCDYNGDNPSFLINSSDNILAITALLKLYEVTNNQTYLDIANLSYTALDSMFYDNTNGGYYRSNLTGDTNKFAYDNMLISLFLTEIYKIGSFPLLIQNSILEKAEETLDLVISYYLNGTIGFFISGMENWSDPIEEKSALINALAINTLISIYEINLNHTYLEIASEVAEFIEIAFWDSTVVYNGFNSTVNWDGSITLNGTKFLEVNSFIMGA
jgi:hypothetical protein